MKQFQTFQNNNENNYISGCSQPVCRIQTPANYYDEVENYDEDEDEASAAIGEGGGEVRRNMSSRYLNYLRIVKNCNLMMICGKIVAVQAFQS